ncbi:MAG: hypothetical protein ACU0AT_08255 [Tranquillimonas sp.]|jgi:hypothetical protein
MTDRIALGLAAVILALLGLDLWLGLDAHLFLAREFVALIDRLAFWR